MKKFKSRFILVLSMLVYTIFYLWVWSLFLKESAFEFLKPWAILWISSALLCFFIARPRRQFPLLAVVVGSMFGPLGVLMIIMSEKDIRAFKDNEKDELFYKKIFNDLVKLQKKLDVYAAMEIRPPDSRWELLWSQMFMIITLAFKMPSLPSPEEVAIWKKDYAGNTIDSRLGYYADYFKLVTGGFHIKMVEEQDSQAWEMMVSLRKLFVAFDNEYQSRFNVSFPGVEERQIYLNQAIKTLESKSKPE